MTQTAQGETSADSALRIAAEAGRIILESGGETYRAEDVMTALASSFGAWNSECYATPTGLMISCEDTEGRNISLVRRIRKRQMNLEKIELIHTLTRKAVGGEIDQDGFDSELCRIETVGAFKQPIPIIGAAGIAGFFCMLFGGAWNDALTAAMIGIVIAMMTRYLAKLSLSDFFNNIAGGFLIAALSLVAVWAGVASHADKTIIGAIMLLVPGVAIVNAIRDTIVGDLVAGLARAADAFVSAAGISIGAGIALKLWALLKVAV